MISRIERPLVRVTGPFLLERADPYLSRRKLVPPVK